VQIVHVIEKLKIKFKSGNKNGAPKENNSLLDEV
jgi:hypothetical protein